MKTRSSHKHRLLLLILTLVCFALPSLAQSGEDWMIFQSLTEPTYTQARQGYTMAVYQGETLDFPQDFHLELGQSALVDIQVPEDGLYEIHLAYKNTANSMLPSEVQLKLNGATPFYELNRIKLHSRWTDKGEMETDRYLNQIAPSPMKEDLVLFAGLSDSAGRSADPFLFELKAGSNSLEFTVTEGALSIQGISLRAVQPLNEYKAQPAQGDALIILEAERMAYRNRSSIHGAGEFNSSLSPSDNKQRLINFLDGASFKEAGDSVSYTFEVEQEGWYMLGFHYRQTVKANYPVLADIRIDGQLPSAAAREVPFQQSPGFTHMTVMQGDNPQTFYLTKGSHTVSLTLNNQALTPAFELIDSVLRQINGLSLEIVRLTGGDTGDKYRDYNLQGYIPGISGMLDGWADQLEQTADKLSSLGESQRAGLFSPMYVSADQLRRLAKEPEDLPRRLPELSTGANSAARMLAQQLQDMARNDLSIDTIYFYQQDALLPERAGLMDSVLSGTARFANSFEDQAYSTTGGSNENLQVWVGRPRQYVEILQNMVDAQFTKQTGIRVDLSLMSDANKLVLSNAAGTAPDAVLSLQYVVPSYLNIRGALADLAQFEDFGEVASRFPSGLFVPYTLGEGVYALPETVNFWVMFYRSDIFRALNIPLPNDLDGVKAILPELQRRNMNFFYPTAGMVGLKVFPGTLPLILQSGGSIYGNTVGNTTLDSEASLAGFREMTDLFTIYNLPVDVPAPGFYQQFRAGTLPIGIADLATYNLLLNAAPELEGLWDIAPFPGLIQEDGSVARWTTGGAETMGILSQSKRQDEAWQFLKWWSSKEVQSEFGNLLQSTFGSEYIWPTANTEAFAQLPLASRHKQVIIKQMQWMTEAPWVLGTYMLERELSNAYISVVVDGTEARRALDTAIKRINRETYRKLEEFGYYSKGVMLKEMPTPTMDVVQRYIDEWKTAQGEAQTP